MYKKKWSAIIHADMEWMFSGLAWTFNATLPWCYIADHTRAVNHPSQHKTVTVQHQSPVFSINWAHFCRTSSIGVNNNDNNKNFWSELFKNLRMRFSRSYKTISKSTVRKLVSKQENRRETCWAKWALIWILKPAFSTMRVKLIVSVSTTGIWQLWLKLISAFSMQWTRTKPRRWNFEVKMCKERKTNNSGRCRENYCNLMWRLIDWSAQCRVVCYVPTIFIGVPTLHYPRNEFFLIVEARVRSRATFDNMMETTSSDSSATEAGWMMQTNSDVIRQAYRTGST